MKKLLSTYIIFSFLFLHTYPVMAKIHSANVKIKKNNNKYCLYSKKENKLLIPCIYDKIEKLGKEAVKVQQNNKYGIFYNTGEVAIPVKYDIAVMHYEKNEKNEKIPQYYGADLKNKIIESKLSDGTGKKIFEPNIHYKNYPSQNYMTNNWACVWKPNQQYLYFHILHKGNNNIISILDTGKSTYYPDEKSLAGISYFSDAIISEKNNKWGVTTPDGITRINYEYDKIITFDAYINEELRENEIIYHEISFPEKDKFIALKSENLYIFDINGKLLYKGKKPNIPFNANSARIIQEIFERNNLNSIIKFKNYPQTGIILYKENNKYGLIVSNSKTTIKLPAKYDGFIFPDDNSVAFNLLGISFASLNNIYAYNEDINKKFLIKTIDRYNNGVNIKETTRTLLPAKIKETITFNNFGATISYDSIIIPDNIHTNTLIKDTAFDIYETSNIGVTIDTSKSKPDIKTRGQGWNPTATTKDKAIAIITAPIWLPIVIVCFPVFMFLFREG